MTLNGNIKPAKEILDFKAEPSYVYTTIDPPGAVYSTAVGINNAGQIVGAYQDLRGLYHS